MLRFALNRLAMTIPALVVVTMVVFLLVHLTPGSPIDQLANDITSPEQVSAVREKLGLDRPLIEQFGLWFVNLLRLDLGNSIYSGLPVTRLIAQSLEPSIVLAIVTILLSTLIAVPMGALAAWNAGGSFDRAVMFFAVGSFSVPVFVSGYAAIYVFSLQLDIFPVQGYEPLSGGISKCLYSIALPSLVLSGVFSALIARVTRATMIESFTENYIRTARAKGVSEFRVVFVHALKNVGVPVLTVIGVGFALLIGGVVVTETVFNIPGLGRLTADAILKRDYPVIQGALLLFSLLLVAVNVLIDFAYTLIDPRIRY